MIIHSVGMGGFLHMNSHTISKTKVEASKTDKGTSTESTSATSKKENTTSLSDSVVKKIQEMAQEGAAKGVYIGNDYISLYQFL
ncbi:hypothetical protein ACSVC9_09060 [Clostridium sp. LBM24168]